MFGNSDRPYLQPSTIGKAPVRWDHLNHNLWVLNSVLTRPRPNMLKKKEHIMQPCILQSPVIVVHTGMTTFEKKKSTRTVDLHLIGEKTVVQSIM